MREEQGSYTRHNYEELQGKQAMPTRISVREAKRCSSEATRPPRHCTCTVRYGDHPATAPVVRALPRAVFLS